MEIDSASRARLRLVYPDLAVKWRRVAEDFWNIHRRALRVSEGLRTIDWQAKLYAQGRTEPGKIVTHALPGESIHHYGLAIDSVFRGPDPYLEHDPQAEFFWREYGRISVSHGLEWGGAWTRFVDRPHVQSVYGLKLTEIKELHGFRGLEGVWARCDQIRGLPIGTEWFGPQASVRLLNVIPSVDSTAIV